MYTKIIWLPAFVLFTGLLFCLSNCTSTEITPETALESYLNNGDENFNWVVNDTFEVNGTRGHELILTSQAWRDYTWKHQLSILVPETLNQNSALLFISGGSNQNGEPNFRSNQDQLSRQMAGIARQNNAIVSVVRQVPNQPLYGNLTEDALISYTLHHFREDGDYTWPLLFPMVKSAVKAMDAIQDYSSENLVHEINNFVVSGLSKRGWTTWLTGAHDTRVTAIAPMVIDVLNMPENLAYQTEVWNDYSRQIQDYVRLGIPQQTRSDTGRIITTMVDPYSYRQQLTMPKMLFMGTNDPYWPVDAVKHYLDSIPGKNFIHYVPNAGHDLLDHDQTVKALNAFFGYTISQEAYPSSGWKIIPGEQKINLKTTTTENKLVGAILWSAQAEERDFRNSQWTSKSMNTNGVSEVSVETAYPASGFKAFYLDLLYKDLDGNEFTKSSRMFVADEDQVFLTD